MGNNMFVYCLNNPVLNTDTSGYIATTFFDESRDRLNPFDDMSRGGGTGSGSGAGSSTGTLVGTTISFGLLMGGLTPSQSQRRVVDPVIVYQEKEDSKKTYKYIEPSSTNYQYWEASRVSNQVIIGKGLAFTDAAARVASGGDIICANQGAAIWLLVINGYWAAVGPEIHGDENYYWHYHPNRNSHTHIWYYS